MFKTSLAWDTKGGGVRKGTPPYGLLDQGCYKDALTPAAVKQFNADPTAIAYSVQLFIPADAPTVQWNYYSAPVSGREAQKRSGVRFTVVGGLIDCSAVE